MSLLHSVRLPWWLPLFVVASTKEAKVSIATADVASVLAFASVNRTLEKHFFCQIAKSFLTFLFETLSKFGCKERKKKL